MKKITSFLVFVALTLAPMAGLEAQQSPIGACPFGAGSLVVSYDEMITVSNTALPFTAATYKPTDGRPASVCALVVVNSNSIAWKANGTPTASVGAITASGGSFSIGQYNLASFRMIRVGSDASVSVQYMTLAQ